MGTVAAADGEAVFNLLVGGTGRNTTESVQVIRIGQGGVLGPLVNPGVQPP
jgi:hypothetical protein